MPQRLGDLLSAQQLVAPRDIDEALKLQKIHGGRLGSILVELEKLDLRALAEVLRGQLGVPIATEDMISRVDAATAQRLTRDQVERFQALPLRVEGRRLHVAMIAPQNLKVLEELQFLIGLRVVPYVAPELQIAYWMKKRYGVESGPRFVRLPPEELISRSAGRRPGAEGAPAATPGPAPAPKPRGDDEVLRQRAALFGPSFDGSLEEAEVPAPAPVAPAAPRPVVLPPPSRLPAAGAPPILLRPPAGSPPLPHAPASAVRFPPQAAPPPVSPAPPLPVAKPITGPHSHSASPDDPRASPFYVPPLPALPEEPEAVMDGEVLEGAVLEAEPSGPLPPLPAPAPLPAPPPLPASRPPSVAVSAAPATARPPSVAVSPAAVVARPPSVMSAPIPKPPEPVPAAPLPAPLTAGEDWGSMLDSLSPASSLIPAPPPVAAPPPIVAAPAPVITPAPVVAEAPVIAAPPPGADLEMDIVEEPIEVPSPAAEADVIDVDLEASDSGEVGSPVSIALAAEPVVAPAPPAEVEVDLSESLDGSHPLPGLSPPPMPANVEVDLSDSLDGSRLPPELAPWQPNPAVEAAPPPAIEPAPAVVPDPAAPIAAAPAPAVAETAGSIAAALVQASADTQPVAAVVVVELAAAPPVEAAPPPAPEPTPVEVTAPPPPEPAPAPVEIAAAAPVEVSPPPVAPVAVAETAPVEVAAPPPPEPAPAPVEAAPPAPETAPVEAAPPPPLEPAPVEAAPPEAAAPPVEAAPPLEAAPPPAPEPAPVEVITTPRAEIITFAAPVRTAAPAPAEAAPTPPAPEPAAPAEPPAAPVEVAPAPAEPVVEVAAAPVPAVAPPPAEPIAAAAAAPEAAPPPPAVVPASPAPHDVFGGRAALELPEVEGEFELELSDREPVAHVPIEPMALQPTAASLLPPSSVPLEMHDDQPSGLELDTAAPIERVPVHDAVVEESTLARVIDSHRASLNAAQTRDALGEWLAVVLDAVAERGAVMEVRAESLVPVRLVGTTADPADPSLVIPRHGSTSFGLCLQGGRLWRGELNEPDELNFALRLGPTTRSVLIPIGAAGGPQWVVWGVIPSSLASRDADFAHFESLASTASEAVKRISG